MALSRKTGISLFLLFFQILDEMDPIQFYAKGTKVWKAALLNCENVLCRKLLLQAPHFRSMDICVCEMWTPRYRDDRCNRNTQVGGWAKQEALGEDARQERLFFAKTTWTLLLVVYGLCKQMTVKLRLKCVFNSK